VIDDIKICIQRFARNRKINYLSLADRFIEHGSVKELMNEIDLTAAKVAENVKLISSRRKQKRA